MKHSRENYRPGFILFSYSLLLYSSFSGDSPSFFRSFLFLPFFLFFFFLFSIASITITASLVAANEWRAAATLMNRLWAARHTDIMVPTADSWNCCARASWQINRRGREEREEERIELIFRSGQRLSTHDLFQFNVRNRILWILRTGRRCKQDHYTIIL